MKAKRLIFGAGIVFCVTWLVLLFTNVPKEPVYQKRTLRQWLHEYDNAWRLRPDSLALAKQDECRKAIRAMGTNCLPFVIKWMSKDYPDFLASFHRNESGSAREVLEILGEEAQPVIPALIQLTYHKDKEVRWYAFNALRDVITPAKDVFVPILVRLFHDPDKNIHYYAGEELAGLDAEAAEKAGVFNTFPHFRVFLETNVVEDAQPNNVQSK